MRNSKNTGTTETRLSQDNSSLQKSHTRFSTTNSQMSSKRFKRTSNSKQVYKLSRSKSKDSLFLESQRKPIPIYIKPTKNESNLQQVSIPNKNEHSFPQTIQKIQSRADKTMPHSILRKPQNFIRMSIKSRFNQDQNQQNFENSNFDSFYQSKSSRKSFQKQLNKQKMIDRKIDRQIKIIDLEKQLVNEKRNKQKQQMKVKMLEDQLIKTKKQLNVSTEQNDRLRKANIQERKKFERMEQNMKVNEKILSEAHGNMEKLKKAIKQSRQQQLADLNKKYEKQIESLKVQKAALLTKLADMQEQHGLLRKQIYDLQEIRRTSAASMRENHLLKQIQSLKDKLRISQSQRQETLQEKVGKLQEQLRKNKEETNTLMVKISCINKKSSDQISQIKMAKESQLNNLKKKVIKMSRQMKQSELVIKSADKQQIYRSCFLKDNKARKESQNFDLELSPQSCPES